MTIAYLDCSAGISGDMCLGALVDAGVPLRKIEKGLRGLPLRGYRIEAKEVKRAGITATKVDVIITCRGGAVHSQKTWKDIRGIVKASTLSEEMKRRGLRIFRRLFEAEGKVHGEPPGKTHLHELGAVDCIVDIFGALIGFDHLEVDRVYSSAVNLGSGSVKTEHGRLPVPAPATIEILRDMPVYFSGIPYELTTPTGAVILKEIADGFDNIPSMKIKNIGYGAGQRDIKGFPNTLRIILGDDVSKHDPIETPGVLIIETNIDDMNPQLYEYVMERLFKAGALDVYLTQVVMKKGRPGIVLTVLCPEGRKTDIIGILFRETTTIGVRFYESSRIILKREIREMETRFGKVKVKLSRMDDGAVRFSPEYEDCKRIAKRFKMPLREVIEMVSKSKGAG